MLASEIVGTAASIASFVLSISPWRDVRAIYQTGSVADRSIAPYCMMIIDGSNWLMFAVLVDDVYPIGVTNAFGAFAGSIYTFVYLKTSYNDKRARVRRRAWAVFMGTMGVILAMITACTVLSLVWSVQVAVRHVGYVIDIFTMLLYGSPLVLTWKVITTKSTSGMYLPLTLTIIAAASLWSSYGILTGDWWVTTPQSIGLFAGLVQLALFAMFGVADNNAPEAVATVISPPSSTTSSDASSNKNHDSSDQDPTNGGNGRKGNGRGGGKLNDGGARQSPDGRTSKAQLRLPLIENAV